MPAAVPIDPSSSEAFSRLVASELPGLFRRARRILPSDDLAWDAVQEALVRVWRMGGTVRPPRGVLARLVVLSALHLSRCARRRGHHEECAARSGPCCPDDPLGAATSAELRCALVRALGEITTSRRRVFELFELEGRDYREIAHQLEVPVGTVRSRLHRARRELRERLSAAWADGGPEGT
jgi:RNA polymerase sigma-70 factor (ECF subfamily)